MSKNNFKKMGKIKTKEVKLVLVGDGYCGKSTLIAAFYNGQFVEKYTPTIFDTFTVTTDIYKKHVNLEICDSAGQEEFSRVRPLSYPEADAIILCFSIDSRESSQNLSELWIPEIRHFCNKIPIILVGCKIDLRLNRSTNSNRNLMVKQDQLNNLNRINSLSNHNNSLNYGLFKTLALYCCRHGRLCTCYHSRICSTNCLSSLNRKPSNLSNSSNCLSTTKISQCNKDNLIRCNRLLLQQHSPTRNSTNTEDSFSSSEADAEELHSNTMSNTISNSSCSLTNDLNGHLNDPYNSSINNIYRHNQSMLNTLIHQQIEHQYNNSLNSSESEESEIIFNQDDQQINQINNDLIETNSLNDHHLSSQINNHLTSINDQSIINDHLQSSIEESKNQSFLFKNLHNRSKLFKGYKNFVNSSIETSKSFKLDTNKSNLDLDNKESTTSLKDRKLIKNSSLKKKLSMMFRMNTSSSTIYPSKSEKKLTNGLFYNRKLNTSNSSLITPFPLIYKTESKIDESLNKSSFNSPFVTREEGFRLCSQIGAQAYVECSSKMNIGVEEVFKTALKLSIKHPLTTKLDLCSLS